MGSVPEEVVKLLKQGPATHLQQHAYAYVLIKASMVSLSSAQYSISHHNEH